MTDIKRAVLAHYSRVEQEARAVAAVVELGACRPLTDVDVRHPDPDDKHQGMIEVATFCEGEYIESAYITRERATELRDQLTALVSWAGPPIRPEGWYPCRTCGCLMDANDADEATRECCGPDDLPEPGELRETGK